MLWIVSVGGHAQQPPADAWVGFTLGDYRFGESAEDRFRKSPRADLAGGFSYVGDVVELNGEYEHGGGKGYRAVVDMPALHQDTFTVALQFWASDFDTAPNTDGPWWRLRWWLFGFGWIASPPASSGHDTLLMAGKSYRWMGYKVRDGELCLTLNNATVVHPFRGVAVGLDRWHSIVASVDVKSKRVATTLDGVRLPDFTLPDGFQWNNVVDRTAPDERQFTFTDYSDGTCFHGYVARLRVLDRSLEGADLERFSVAAGRELPVFVPPQSGVRRVWLLLVAGILGILILTPVVHRWVGSARRRRAMETTGG